MKTIKLAFILLVVSTGLFAQFPAPVNFQFGYEYIELDDWGVCNGKGIEGPGYCSSFSWETPDMSTTTANLTKYKIYYKSEYNQTYVIDSITGNFCSREIGIIGSIWVTAVYSNPNGESLASNVIVNVSLPIEVKETKESKKLQIRVDNAMKRIIIDSELIIQQVSIISMDGRIIYIQRSPANTIQTENIQAGLYIIKIDDSTGKSYYHKTIL